MTYRELCQRLASVYDMDEARAVVRLLLGERFGLSMADILCDKVTELSADDRTELEKMMHRLENGEPVQYVLGYATFCGRRFRVGPDVLIPRPETEELCQWLISGVQEFGSSGVQEKSHSTLHTPHSSLHTPHPSLHTPHPTPNTQHPTPNIQHSTLNPQPSPLPHLSILDIGTGSGCIAVTLAAEWPKAQVSAWDISEKALKIARENAERNGANVDFEQVDILNPFNIQPSTLNPQHPTPNTQHPTFNILISNPPYVCESEKAAMERNVLQHEPHLALFVPDDDPLRFYRAIAEFARHALKPNGWLFFEINPAYADDIVQMLQEMPFEQVTLKTDSFGKKRFLRTKIK